MPGFNELEVFHKILREAALAQKPPQECDTYLQLSAEDKNEFDILFLIWNKSQNVQNSEEFNTAAAFQKFKTQIQKETGESINTPIISLTKPWWSNNMLRYAAIFLFLLAATYFFISRPDQFSGGDSGLYVHLQDGSHIWLKKDATLTVKKLGKQLRKVELQGVAYFNVQSDTSNAFIIETNQMEIAVLGTEFTVDGNVSVVEVYAGDVEVKNFNLTEKLHANEKITFKNGELEKVNFKGEKPAWINPILSFDNASLETVIGDLEAFFGVSITIHGSSNTANCTFTSGSLAQTSLDDILTVLKLTFEMNIEKTGDNSYRFSNVLCKNTSDK